MRAGAGFDRDEARRLRRQEAEQLRVGESTPSPLRGVPAVLDLSAGPIGDLQSWPDAAIAWLREILARERGQLSAGRHPLPLPEAAPRA